jgi:hypothetical protein
VNVDIGRDRKRTGNVTRSEVIRERIEDHLMRSGGRNSKERYLAIREDFITTAVRTAQRAGLRTWKGDDEHRLRDSAAKSLKVLFGEFVVVSRASRTKPGSGAVNRTGVNSGWVLDIWEATLDHITREDHLSRETKLQAEIAAGDTKGTYTEPTDGPKVFNITAAAPVSVRLLEAYLARDDETIMRIAVELEHEENGDS